MSTDGLVGDRTRIFKAGVWARRLIALALMVFLLCPPWLLTAVAQQAEAEVLLAQAILAYDDGDYDRARSMLLRVVELAPDNVRALYYLGLVHLATQQPEQAVEPLARAHRLRPDNLLVAYHLGVAYFTVGAYDKAEPLLLQVYAENPDLEGVGFYVGFLRYRKQLYDKALEAFEQARITNPDMRQLIAFYKGLTLGVLGLSDEAVDELDEALAIPSNDPLTGATLQLRNALRTARRSEKRWFGEVTLGGFYNDNVALNPDPSDDPLAEFLRRRSSTSTGLLLGADLNYAWLRQGPYESVVSYSFFQTLNLNGILRKFNVQNHLGQLDGFARGTIWQLPYQVGLSYAFDYTLLDNAAFLARHSPSLSVTVVEGANHLTTGSFRFQNKSFFRQGDLTERFPAADRDALNWMGGVTHVLRFARDRHLLSVGYQFDVEDAAGSNFSYTGHKLLAGWQYTLPWWDIKLRYNYQRHWRDYRSLNSRFPILAPGTVKRDDEQNHLARIEVPLPYNLLVGAQYQRVANDSNLAVFDYTQNIWTITTSWSF